MRVFRVEDTKGAGAYHQASARGIDSTPRSHRPMAYDDGIDDHHSGHVFGFVSMAAFHNWFDEKRDHQLLNDHGYSVVEYEVAAQHVHKGRCQLVFIRDQAELISMHSLI